VEARAVAARGTIVGGGVITAEGATGGASGAAVVFASFEAGDMFYFWYIETQKQGSIGSWLINSIRLCTPLYTQYFTTANFMSKSVGVTVRSCILKFGRGTTVSHDRCKYCMMLREALGFYALRNLA
jgi:hypothetical protein